MNASTQWSFITDINNKYGLPKNLLYAIGSRETNLRNVVGDGGHGHGVFQLDNRSHQIPTGFDQDVHAQAETAAQMLQALHKAYGDWTKACNAYNSGSPLTSHTAGGDYGPDVMARQGFLEGLADPIPQQSGSGPSSIPDMSYGQKYPVMAKLQVWFNKNFPLYSNISPTEGDYGPQTTKVIAEFQKRVGIVGGDGRNVGDQTKQHLWDLGFRP